VIALVLLLATMQAAPVVRCSVTADPHGRVYELQRLGEGDGARWQIALRSREAGSTPVVMALPDARPLVSDRHVALDYRTLNGGRTVKWTVDAAGSASLDVYANFELEVNVEADLDPRVEMMNTDGAIRNLACVIPPKP
jgi:hypothetical protein